MALDPSIILQLGKGITPLKSPGEIQDEQMQREMGSYKLNALRQSTEDDQATRNALRTTNSLADVPNALLKAGNLKGAQEAQKVNSEAMKSQREAQKAELEGHLKQFELAGQIMNGVSDQTSWDRARQETARIFGAEKAAQMPAQYDPQLIAQNQARAMAVKDQVEQQYKRLTFGETQRHNMATESNTLTTNANSVGATDRATQQRASSAAATLESKNNPAPKPIPAAALKMQQESLDAIGTASSINSDLDAINTQIKDGKLKFGPVGNLANRAMNATGMSSEESRNFASFQANMEKLRNDSLRLNKGVQTDGDAQRAWNELFSNINDTKVVQQRLGEIKALNERAVQLRKLDIDNIRTNYGHEPMDTQGYSKQPAALNGGKVAPAAGAVPDLTGIEAELKRRGLLK